MITQTRKRHSIEIVEDNSDETERPNAETLAALQQADEIIRAHRARMAALRNDDGLR